MTRTLAAAAAFSSIFVGGCDVYREVLDKGVEADRPGDPRPAPDKAPPPPDADGACGCEADAQQAYLSCMNQVSDEHGRGQCGSRYQAIFSSCAAACDEGPCAGHSGTGFYKFGSESGAHGHTPEISCVEALANCSLNSWVNGAAWTCTWNGIALGGEAAPPASAKPDVQVFCATEAGYQPSTSVFSSSARGRMDVLRIYESRGDHRAGYHPMGDVKVSLDSADTEVLVLSSYEPTRWHVGGNGRLGLRLIILTGYHEQDVVAPADVKIMRFVGPGQWLESGSDRSRDGETLLLEKASAIAERKPTTSSYCYQGTGFIVR